MAVLQVCDLGSLSLAKVREGCLHFRLNLELSFARLAPKAAKRLETTHACLDWAEERFFCKVRSQMICVHPSSSSYSKTKWFESSLQARPGPSSSRF